jgi:anhydro-N-acetylmuramic acid kinase
VRSETRREDRQRRQRQEDPRADGPASYHRSDAGANGRQLVIGLSSGTSMDGIDAALVEFSEPEAEAGAENRAGGEGIDLLAFRTQAYPQALRSALATCCRGGSCADVARLNVAVGEVFAAVALDLLARTEHEPADVSCIGSHGQTLIHLPQAEEIGGMRVKATLQIGELSVIAERTGITTVGDFRARDMAAGGEGAPLVPILDHKMITHPVRGRVALNLGGIANVTGLPAGGSRDDLIAFDTGPANVLLDAAARERQLEGGIDEGGALAMTGVPDPDLLQSLMTHLFFERRPPKSADLGFFSGDYAERCWAAATNLSTADLLRTLAELTARTVADGIDRFVAPHQAVDEVVVSGGGAHNAAVMSALQEHLPDVRVLTADEVLSIPGDAKEAVLFAYLGHLALARACGNVPSATGARRAVVLGKIVPGM